MILQKSFLYAGAQYTFHIIINVENSFLWLNIFVETEIQYYSFFYIKKYLLSFFYLYLIKILLFSKGILK